ncbi:hypothetical protein B0H14DRAFT_2821231 [Mycena olivaceomarginata]|nr:hypothetical protein B0H14DRAFT_2821231 [Mycena olivaceomarginata]
MGQLRTSLGMGKARWNALRVLTAICFALAAARLDPTENWKAQEKDRIMAACNVVKEDYPEMGRFYVTNPETYRGRITAARRGARRQQQRSPARFPPPRSAPASPIAGPSRVGGRSTSTPLFNDDPGERDQHQKSAVGNDEEHHDVINFDEAVGRFDKGKKQTAEDAEENPGASKRWHHK